MNIKHCIIIRLTMHNIYIYIYIASVWKNVYETVQLIDKTYYHIY